MQERVSNQAQAQAARQEILNLRMLPGEAMRNYLDRAMRLAACLPECPGEEQVKPQIIMGLQPKLRTAALLAQSLPFDSMISTIKQIMTNEQIQPPQRSRERLQVMEENVAEELAELAELKKRQFNDGPREYKTWNKKANVTLESPIGPREDVFPFGFTSEITCYRCKLISHLASFLEVICQRIRPAARLQYNQRRQIS